VGINGPECRRKREAGEREHGISNIGYCFHMFFPFIFFLQDLPVQVLGDLPESEKS
jgi:hypothetical protein